MRPATRCSHGCVTTAPTTSSKPRHGARGGGFPNCAASSPPGSTPTPRRWRDRQRRATRPLSGSRSPPPARPRSGGCSRRSVRATRVAATTSERSRRSALAAAAKTHSENGSRLLDGTLIAVWITSRNRQLHPPQSSTPTAQQQLLERAERLCGRRHRALWRRHPGRRARYRDHHLSAFGIRARSSTPCSRR